VSYVRSFDGAEIAWDAEGTGPALLLLSGQATGAAGWGPVVAPFASTFRVIRFDPRGVVRSSPGRPESYTTRLMARDAIAVLDAAGVDAAHVYGHSMGGRIAQWLAIDHPDRVASLILAATSPGGVLGSRRHPDATAALTSGSIARLTPYFFDADWAADHPQEVRAFFTARAAPEVKALHFRASRNHDALEHVARISAPTLILHGLEDELTPLENGVALYDAIPHSTLVRVDGGKHGFHLDHPQTVGWISDFIRRRAAL
jgi:pimeloyl-ACP methyl ester carboxylesterase